MIKKFIAIFIVAFVLMFTSGCGTPKNIIIDVKAPLQETIDNEFDIIVNVKNTSSKAQKLVSLDIGDDYLKGIVITKTVPNYIEAYHVPIDDTMSYVYDKTIPANGDVKIILKAKALKTGDYDDEIDVCINSDYSFLTKPVRTIVSN